MTMRTEEEKTAGKRLEAALKLKKMPDKDLSNDPDWRELGLPTSSKTLNSWKFDGIPAYSSKKKIAPVPAIASYFQVDRKYFSDQTSDVEFFEVIKETKTRTEYRQELARVLEEYEDDFQLFNRYSIQTESFRLKKNDILNKIKIEEKYGQVLNSEECELKFLCKQSKNNDTLVILIPGLMLDHRDYSDFLITNKTDTVIAVSLLGFYPRQIPVDIPLNVHIKLLAKFIEAKIEEFEPKKTILTGFSIGADIGFELIDILEARIDGFISLDCNLDRDTLFISSKFAKIDPEAASSTALDTIKEISQGEDIATLEQWLVIHGYLVKVFSKFHDRLNILKNISNDIYCRFKDKNIDDFVEKFERIDGKVRLLCVFSGQHEKAALEIEEKLWRKKKGENQITRHSKGHFDLIEFGNLNFFIKMMKTMLTD